MNGISTVRDKGRGKALALGAVLGTTVLLVLVFSLPAWAQTKTLNLSMLAGFKEDVLRANLPEFEKKTGIKVAVDAAPLGELYKKQLLALSTGARYDVLFMDEPWIPALSEFLSPLDERAKGLDMQDFIPTTVAAGAFQGKQYALPVDPNVQILIYRKDLFAQKGLKPPATWEELLKIGKGMHDPAKPQYGFVLTASNDIQTINYMLLVMWSYGAEIVDSRMRGALNSEAGKKGGEVFLELVNLAPPAVKTYTFADVNKAIQLGQAVMGIQWASGAKPMEDKTRPGRGLGVRQVAQQPGVRPGLDQVPQRHLGHPQSAGVGAFGPGHARGAPVCERAAREPAGSEGAAAAQGVCGHPGVPADHRGEADGGRAEPQRCPAGDGRGDQQDAREVAHL